MLYPIKSTNEYPALINILGDEPWLAEIYGHFERVEQTLTGKLQISEKAAGQQFLVEGTINFIPYIPCDRCGELQLFPIKMEICALFNAHDRYAGQKDVKLQRSDLDSYLIQNSCLDIGQVVLDGLHEALPSSFLPGEDSGNCCPHCLKDQIH